MLKNWPGPIILLLQQIDAHKICRSITNVKNLDHFFRDVRVHATPLSSENTDNEAPTSPGVETCVRVVRVVRVV